MVYYVVLVGLVIVYGHPELVEFLREKADRQLRGWYKRLTFQGSLKPAKRRYTPVSAAKPVALRNKPPTASLRTNGAPTESQLRRSWPLRRKSKPRRKSWRSDSLMEEKKSMWPRFRRQSRLDQRGIEMLELRQILRDEQL